MVRLLLSAAGEGVWFLIDASWLPFTERHGNFRDALRMLRMRQNGVAVEQEAQRFHCTASER